MALVADGSLHVTCAALVVASMAQLVRAQVSYSVYDWKLDVRAILRSQVRTLLEAQAFYLLFFHVAKNSGWMTSTSSVW